MDTLFFTQEWIFAPLPSALRAQGTVLDLKLEGQESLHIPGAVEEIVTPETNWTDLIARVKPSIIIYRAINLSTMTSAVKSTVYESLALIKALRGMDVRLIFAGTQSHPIMGAISGICKTCALESKKHRFSVLTLETWDKDLLLKELSANDPEVRYVAGKREVKKNSEVEYLQLGSKIRRNGTYLITGGTGGLGLIFAQYLEDNYQANVILVGRRKTAETKMKYLVCDISDEQSVKELARQLKGTRIDGILHCAGTNKDNFIPKKTAAELDMVVPPKTFGVEYLMKAFPPKDMDFLLLFSSTAASFGNSGQFDYSFANNYLDALAQVRPNVRSFNWPLWRDGGMQVDAETEKFMDRSMGLVPMSTDTGMAAFEFALASEYKNLGVVTGKAEKMKDVLGIVSANAASLESFLKVPEEEWMAEALKLTSAQRSQLIQKIADKIN